jgi:hypothetical protein
MVDRSFRKRILRQMLLIDAGEICLREVARERQVQEHSSVLSGCELVERRKAS